MIRNHGTDDHTDDDIETEADPEAEARLDAALRLGLLTHADLLTITAPPIAAVRRRAQRRRRRRGVIQGVSGLAALCAVVAGIVAWSPDRQAGGGPMPSRGATSPASSPANTSRTASEPGPGWRDPTDSPNRRTEILMDVNR